MKTLIALLGTRTYGYTLYKFLRKIEEKLTNY